MVDVGEAAAGQPNFSGSSERNAWRTTSGPKINQSSIVFSISILSSLVVLCIQIHIQNSSSCSLLITTTVATNYCHQLLWFLLSITAIMTTIVTTIIRSWLFHYFHEHHMGLAEDKVPPNLMVNHPSLFQGSQLGLCPVFKHSQNNMKTIKNPLCSWSKINIKPQSHHKHPIKTTKSPCKT